MSDTATVRDPELHVLQHALGLDDYGQGTAYRNHYAAGPGHDGFDICMAHAAAGRMERRGPIGAWAGDYCFVVTEAGRAYVAERSPKPPRLTRSQQRYRDFLRADCGLQFGEWLRYERRAGTVKLDARQPEGAGAEGDAHPGHAEQPVGSAAHGLPERLVRRANREALRALGNAVVPAVVAEIGRAILAAEARVTA